MCLIKPAVQGGPFRIQEHGFASHDQPMGSGPTTGHHLLPTKDFRLPQEWEVKSWFHTKTVDIDENKIFLTLTET